MIYATHAKKFWIFITILTICGQNIPIIIHKSFKIISTLEDFHSVINNWTVKGVKICQVNYSWWISPTASKNFKEQGPALLPQTRSPGLPGLQIPWGRAQVLGFVGIVWEIKYKGLSTDHISQGQRDIRKSINWIPWLCANILHFHVQNQIRAKLNDPTGRHRSAAQPLNSGIFESFFEPYKVWGLQTTELRLFSETNNPSFFFNVSFCHRDVTEVLNHCF